MVRIRRGIVALAAILFLGLAAAWASGIGREKDQPVGLFSTLPILWAESATLTDMLKSPPRPHWAKAELTQRGGIVPLDSLGQLHGFGVLLMAQPRPLSPQENVALDDWVHQGGRVLLFADPLLTAPSAFAPGDKRRPQDVVLLSPILTRWGLRLEFEESQPFGERATDLYGDSFPVNLPGRFVAAKGEGACTLAAGGLAAECRIGKGRVLAVADAALFETGDEGAEAARRAVLGHLLDRLETAN